MPLYMTCTKFQTLFRPSFGFKIVSMLENRRLSYLVCKRIRSQVQSSFVGNSYHISHCLLKRRKTAEERKSSRLIEYSPKSKAEIIGIWRGITAGQLAELLERDIQYVRDLFLNQVNSPNTVLNDMQLLQQAIHRSGRRMKFIAKPDKEIEETVDNDVFKRPSPSKEDLKPRPPVVTVMGHVDHGKTTLLDALRHSSVVKQEFGGITQHVGAFSVILESGAKITFLDTPGHAAFSAMRARGANLTDIVVLVVAADDGVMEQTIESIKMAKNANVPILVAINKIDSPKADVDRTEKMLLEIGIQVEKFGGDVQAIPISALKRQNLDQLTEAIMLQAELLEVGGDPTGPVEAVVVDSKIHPHRGRLCTVVVQRGTLSKGNVLVAGTAMGRVRVLKNAEGQEIDHVSPGYPVEIEGWKDLPSAGEQVLQVESDKRAREVIKIREDKKRLLELDDEMQAISQKQEQHEREYKERLQLKRKLGRFKLRKDGPRKPESISDDGKPSLNVIVKSDVDGTLEAILQTLDTYESDECPMDLVHYGVGTITNNDVELAATFNAIIYCFNVDCPNNIKEQADSEGVKIKYHNVIYKLIDDVKEEINNRLPSKEVEDQVGEAVVLQQFEINQGRKKIPTAGCKCHKGSLKRSASFRLLRNGIVLYEGPLSSMRHLKSEVDVIKTETECGIQLQDKSLQFEKGDILVCFEKKVETQKTDWNPGF